MKTADVMNRARRTAASAKLLFDAGDLHGACNRTYYAMFDAARAALLAAEEPVKPEVIKTHSGIISIFSRRLIKPGFIPAQHGKSLSKVDRIRLVADYSDEEIDRETAMWAVEQANIFVEVIANHLKASR